MIDIFKLLEKAESDEEVNELYNMTLNDVIRKYSMTPDRRINNDDIDQEE